MTAKQPGVLEGDTDEVFDEIVSTIEPRVLDEATEGRSRRWIRKAVRRLAPPKASGASWA